MKNTNKISTCLWFDPEFSGAEEAANFYTSVFENASIKNTTPYLTETPSNKPAGSVMTVDFEVGEHRFTALNGGPNFTPNPSISFFVNFDPSRDEDVDEKLEQLWERLGKNGKVLMELDEYPFSPKYGWIEDKFGISWQLILSNSEGEDRPTIVPSFMFCRENTNKAEEAVSFYTSVFKKSKDGNLFRYPEDTGPAKEGSLVFGDFMIDNTWMAVMDSSTEQDFTFNEAISLVINCENQEEIDYYWDKLSAVTEAEQCGWLKDKYGVSWQVVPENMGELTNSKQAMEAMLKMKKIDIRTLKRIGE